MTDPADPPGNRLLDLLRAGARHWDVMLVGAALLAAWLAAWGSGEAVSVSRHAFYVPVVIAAIRLTPVTAMAVTVLAALLAGPLVPLPDAGIGLAEHGPWVVRGAFLVAIGALVTVLAESVRRYQQQQVDVATHAQRVAAHERDLAIQRAAVVQTMSHELRTPLTVIKGTVETWKNLQVEVTPREAGNLIPPMYRATKRLESLVSTVLAAADAHGIDELAPVEVDVADLVHEAVARAGDGHDRARVQPVIDGAPAAVTTVPDYVVTALSMLVNNALKFSPAGSTVTVSAGRDGDGRLELAVRDHGSGVDDAEVERLFQPFTQADQGTTRVHEGLGVGLYASRKLVRRVAGEVTLATHPDGGAVGRILLPLDGPSPAD